MRIETLALIASCAGLALATPISKRDSPFIFFGTNEAGAEFGQGNLPGELGTDYIWPTPSTIQTLRDAGMNTFRVAFSMERLVPDQITGPPDAQYMADLKSTVNAITSMGAYAVLDPHNFGRYYGNVITSTSDFAKFWTTVAKEFVSNDKVVFDTNNEYHTMDQTLVLNLNQASINAIRAAGATSQFIFVEGNQWSGAWSWVDVNDNMKALTDPEDKIVYEMHQYLDYDSSGTSPNCVSSTIGEERISAATQWLRDNDKKGILGEFAGAANDVCKDAVQGMLQYLAANSDVWTGGLWWAAGPWWGDYMFNMEPYSGEGYTDYLDLLKPYFVGSSGPAPDPTPTTPPTDPTTTPPAPTPTGELAKQWEQCGGNGWTGATVCAAPWTCTKVNGWYSQCL